MIFHIASAQCQSSSGVKVSVAFWVIRLTIVNQMCSMGDRSSEGESQTCRENWSCAIFRGAQLTMVVTNTCDVLLKVLSSIDNFLKFPWASDNIEWNGLQRFLRTDPNSFSKVLDIAPQPIVTIRTKCLSSRSVTGRE
ncbi:hypothetical protein TNCV_3085301 [Trichonephila clavipes]|nr:hypothetical protein TNCV_3085301 [Trichonephila clavipes]